MPFEFFRYKDDGKIALSEVACQGKLSIKSLCGSSKNVKSCLFQREKNRELKFQNDDRANSCKLWIISIGNSPPKAENFIF